mgnify:FL=1
MILGILIAVIALFTVTGAILHATYFKTKYEKISPYGQMVDVNDGQMHVYSMGSGEKTIVLLPGSGVALPSADFGPLMRKLSEKYTVVTVEYFGVGFSSTTQTPRSSENYVEEIRTALTKAGFTPPYVLMPHSISSVISEYFAEKYPTEVEAILSLDGTSSAYYEPMPASIKSLLSVAKYQQAVGSTSIMAVITTNKKMLLGYGYTEKEINDMIVFAGFTMNDTALDEIGNTSEFIKQTMELPYPASVPYFKVISKQTYTMANPQLKKAGLTPQQYQTDHLARIGEQARYEILEGSHFIYMNNVDRIEEIADEFLK